MQQYLDSKYFCKSHACYRNCPKYRTLQLYREDFPWKRVLYILTYDTNPFFNSTNKPNLNLIKCKFHYII